MSYTINPNAKNRWARNAENTMDLSLETDASSVYLDNGRTLEQEIGEGSMVSNVTTVDSGMEKVIDGTYDGAYESCKMYGKSLANLINYNDSNINTSGSYVQFNSMVWDTVGKMVTVFNYGNKIVRTQMSKNGAYYRQLDFEPNTKTLVKLESDEKLERIRGMLANEWTLDEVGLNELKTSTMILEGDWTDKELPPYFTGLCDVKAPILKNVGKNLLDESTLKVGGLLWATGEKYDATDRRRSDFIKVAPNTSYIVSFYNSVNGTTGYFEFNKNKQKLKHSVCGISAFTFTTRSDTYFVRLVTPLEGQVMLEEATSTTPHEDYKTNILETSNDLVLRGLPSGIRDTYDCLTGEYIRRVGERDYQESDESDSNVITDLVKTHYELAEPTITMIEPSTIPFVYENGHIILESGHEGQSLLPTLEYSTIVNKTGLVENVAKTIQRQEKQLTMLEKMLIQNIINLDYNNTLLTLKNEMEEML